MARLGSTSGAVFGVGVGFGNGSKPPARALVLAVRESAKARSEYFRKVFKVLSFWMNCPSKFWGWRFVVNRTSCEPHPATAI